MASVHTVTVNEIFSSIQGETAWAGVPMTFVRLTGCPLRCTYCDTEYAFHEGRRMQIDEIVSEVATRRWPHVVVTGGEPLAQPGSLELLRSLCESGRTVLLETAGSHEISPIDPRVHIIMDLKTPGSGQEERNLWNNLDHLKSDMDEIKFVLCHRGDYDWAKHAVEQYRLVDRARALLFSPALGALDAKDLAEWMLKDALPPSVRLQLQLHKHIWPPDQRGV